MPSAGSRVSVGLRADGRTQCLRGEEKTTLVLSRCKAHSRSLQKRVDEEDGAGTSCGCIYASSQQTLAF